MDLSAFDARVEAIIAKSGWMVQGVFPGAGEPGVRVADDLAEVLGTGVGPMWCYTVGVEALGDREFCIVGLPPDAATPLLNTVVRKCQASGHWYEDGEMIPDVLRGDFELKVVRVSDLEIAHADWFNVATHRRGTRNGFVAMQLVWPNLDRTFSASDRQPILGP